MKKYFILVITFFLIFSKTVNASDVNRYVTIVNPVRGRNFWQSIKSVQRQIDLITGYNLPSTWLLQYDVLNDDIAFNLFKKLPFNQELGILLEVDEKLATDSSVAYLLGDGGWWRSDKVLLSGYELGERKRMIDRVFEAFKKVFGVYPASVGAWYLDTVSLDYIVGKYKIKAILDVADQYTTDSYGLWGKPWGTPYFPSKLNSLQPAKSLTDKLNVVKIQWAARDPIRGYGLTVADSTFSVQANDYNGHHNLDINYFKKLTKTYLFSLNSLTQLTVGIEAGQEGASYLDEYNRQIQFLFRLEKEGGINIRTMAAFAQIFNLKYPVKSPSFFISSDDYISSPTEAYWYSTPYYRVGFLKMNGNLYIRDFRVYKNPFMYFDIYKRDQSHTLKRIIPAIIDSSTDKNEQILITDVDKIQVERNGENITLSIDDKKGIKYQILLTETAVISENKKLFEEVSGNEQIENIVNFIAELLVNYWVKYPHLWIGSVRYSSINNNNYFGLMISPNRLIGLRSKSPFLGVFDFPFQVLVRFKTLPDFDPVKIITANFVNRINNSTIRLLESIKI